MASHGGQVWRGSGWWSWQLRAQGGDMRQRASRKLCLPRFLGRTLCTRPGSHASTYRRNEHYDLHEAARQVTSSRIWGKREGDGAKDGILEDG